MTTTLITDGFDGEDEDYDNVANAYRKNYTKQMTDVAKVLDRARIVYRIKEQ